ncbi:Cof-type HAD-IIB family hydrolase [Ferrimicrobium sp.]|uniref:Cof-type HAD-IIB family hydrolase n=1 Tax=Ferrimicrobium sp. TaxID=2926050 RepID=UPI002636F242|nr:Cof-type HAD-IIB family hydrolase [Ferrimicrobium sp.]
MTKDSQIRLVLADVDGTLVTNEKVLTPRASKAVVALSRAQVLFSLTSGRPPKGMQMLVAPLKIALPFAAFNGGQILSPGFDVLIEHTLDDDLVEAITHYLDRHKLDVWFYAGSNWYVPRLDGSHVDHESATVGFSPEVVPGGRVPSGSIVKIVGVSDDHEIIARATDELRGLFGDRVAAEASQPYYLDVTHPRANKGTVVEYLAHWCGITTEEIATIGDMANDIDMFSRSGLAIAMGNAMAEVQQAADRVTASNEEDGFAEAMEELLKLRGQ